MKNNGLKWEVACLIVTVGYIYRLNYNRICTNVISLEVRSFRVD